MVMRHFGTMLCRIKGDFSMELPLKDCVCVGGGDDFCNFGFYSTAYAYTENARQLTIPVLTFTARGLTFDVRTSDSDVLKSIPAL